MYCVLCSVQCVLYCVLCTVSCVLCPVSCVLCTAYCVLCTVYCVLCTAHCVLRTVYCVASCAEWHKLCIFDLKAAYTQTHIITHGRVQIRTNIQNRRRKQHNDNGGSLITKETSRRGTSTDRDLVKVALHGGPTAWKSCVSNWRRGDTSCCLGT